MPRNVGELLFKNYIVIYVFVVCVCVCMGLQNVYVEGRGPSVFVSSLFPRGSWGLNLSSHLEQ